MPAASPEVRKDRWYPSMPPKLGDETDDAYARRLTGADGADRIPYGHHRSQQCSVGWHNEYDDPDGIVCKCLHHTDRPPGEIPLTAQNAVLRAAVSYLCSLWDLPEATGYRVMLFARTVGAADEANSLRELLRNMIASSYNSPVTDEFLTDVTDIYRNAEAGKIQPPGST